MEPVEGNEGRIVSISKRLPQGSQVTGHRGLASPTPLTLCPDVFNPHSESTARHCYFLSTDEETEAHRSDGSKSHGTSGTEIGVLKIAVPLFDMCSFKPFKQR